MKKSHGSHRHANSNKLTLRGETVRILTDRELTVVIAGNCVYGSVPTMPTALSSSALENAA